MDANLAAAIPPLEHTYKSITYTCVGEGLLKEGFGYDAHPEKFFPSKSSKASKGGTAPEPPRVEKEARSVVESTVRVPRIESIWRHQ